MDNQEKLLRWRLILGKGAEEKLARGSTGGIALSDSQQIMDEALAAIYDETGGERTGSGRGAGLGPSFPKVAKWLGDIRSFFPEDVVSVIQADAIERKGLTQLLFEPETLKQVKPSIEMVATLLSLKGKIPERTKETARQLVKAVVEEITKRLENDLRQAVKGALNRKQHSPLPAADRIDWKYTIQKNLKHYNQTTKTIIPEKFYFFDRKQRANNWTVILDIDQSGSMAGSVIYASIIGSILASMPALNTRVVAFDTEVVDLTEQCAQDPVDMLFGIQLGGGTDINKSVAYCEQFVTEPGKTLFFMITDLYEGGNQAALFRRLREMKEAGVKVICLLALSDEGVPFYDESAARRLAQMGIPCFGCTPAKLPELLEGALKGVDLQVLAQRVSEQKS